MKFKKLLHIFIVVSCIVLSCCYSRSFKYPAIDNDMSIVPNVIGLSIKSSKEILQDKGFTNISVSYGETNQATVNDKEFVIEKQSLVPGNFAERNSEIILNCKKAKLIECINVWSLPVKKAKERLVEAGITHIKTNINEAELINQIDEWLVAEQSVAPNNSIYEYEEIELLCEKGNTVTFVLKSDNHWIFNTYSVSIYIDDEYIVSVDDGETKSIDVPLLCGNHVVKAVGSGMNTYDTCIINITDNNTVRAFIGHDDRVSITFY